MKSGLEFEVFCTEVLKHMKENLFGYNIEIVKHDEQLMGTNSLLNHQTDILCVAEIDGKETKIAIECKDYKNGVPKEKIAVAHSYSIDTGAHPMVVASFGFQSGAIVYGKSLGVDLLTIQKPEDYDFTGLMKNLHLETTVFNCNPEVYTEIGFMDGKKIGRQERVSHELNKHGLLYGSDGDVLFNINDLIYEARQQLTWKKDVITKNLIEIFEEIYFKEGEDLLQLNKLSFTIIASQGVYKTEVLAEKVVKAIITNIHTSEKIIVKK